MEIFIDAGHLLGAAQVILDVTENGSTRRFLFSGDIGRGGDVLLRDPEHAEKTGHHHCGLGHVRGRSGAPPFEKQSG